MPQSEYRGLRRFNAWSEANPLIVAFVVTVVCYFVGTVVLEGGVDWFGLAVSASVWLLILAVVYWRRRRNSH